MFFCRPHRRLKMSSKKGKKPRAGESSRPGSGDPSHSYTAKQPRSKLSAATSLEPELIPNGKSNQRASAGKAHSRTAPSRPPTVQGGNRPQQSRAAAARPPTQSQPQGRKQAGKDSRSEKSLRRSVSPRKEQYSHLLDETVGCGDMVLLEPLTEERLIDNLKLRYKAGEIYVSAVGSYTCTV